MVDFTGLMASAVQKNKEQNPLALTKQTIIESVSERLDLKSTQAKDIIEEFLEIMKSTLAFDEDIMISGFGKFQVNKKSPRKGQNPATGEEMILDGRKVVVLNALVKYGIKLTRDNKGALYDGRRCVHILRHRGKKLQLHNDAI